MDLQTSTQSDGSLQVTFDGKPLICVVCGNDHFDERGSLLNTRGGEFLNLAWAEDKATNFVCTRCGYIFWFLF
jgi:hypothetical protein